MKCERARREMALYVGGDLPLRILPRLLTHLKRCADCAAEFEILKQAQRAIGEIAQADTPERLPDDFSARVHHRLAGKNMEKAHPARWNIGGRRLKLIAGFAVVVAVILAASQLFDFVGESNGPVSGWEKMKREFGDAVQDPVELESWVPNGQPGVFVVLHKPDPINQPELYRFDYCGESARLVSFHGNPWNRQRERRLLSRAGSRDNIYIAVVPLPESTLRERRKITRILIEEFNPFFNRKNGA